MELTLDQIGAKYVTAVHKMDGLVKRCLPLVNDGDRVSYYLQDYYTFVTGANTAQDMMLNNPLDATFFGTRLNIYLQSRLIDTSNPNNNEQTFRPDDWTPVNDWPTASIKQANCQFTIRTPRGNYSNAAVSIAQAFSTRHGVPNSQLPVSAYLGGLDFFRLKVIPRGESMVIRVSPNFSAKPTSTTQREFRVTALLQGFKLARAFR